MLKNLKKDSWIYIFIFLITVATGVTLFLDARAQIDDAVLIDIAGRQRMLSQRIGLFAHQVTSGNTDVIPLLSQHIDLHTASLELLKKGGAVSDVGMPQEIIANSAPDTVLPKIISAENTWSMYHAQLRDLLNAPQNERAALLEQIDETAADMLQKNDAIVKEFVAHTENSQNDFQILILTLLALISISAITGFILVSIEHQLPQA